MEVHHEEILLAARLYAILDMGYVAPEDVERVTAALCQGGADVIQLRAKGHGAAEVEKLALRMQAVLGGHGVPLVINDHPRVAAVVGSQGVHVGQDDEAVAQARAVVGGGCLVGKSTHSVEQARAAAAEGANYIGFGPLYATGTKPDYMPVGLDDIAEVHRIVAVPIFCIGGVNAARLGEVMEAGARRVVVVSAFLLAADIAAEVAAMKRRLLGGVE